jgi:hypothetical protein
MLNASNLVDTQIMDLVRKALSVDSTTGTGIQPFIKEDLEDEAYLQLYSETDRQEMTLLKDLPKQQAQQVNHEFVQVDRYGNHKTKISFAANSLPAQANIEGTKRGVQLKLQGKTTAVQGLTVLQNTVKMLGQPDIASANDLAVRLLLMYQFNTQLFMSDSRFTTDTNVFKGVWQVIDELTRSPLATVPYANTDVFIDLRGKPLLMDGPSGIRSQATAINKRHGVLKRIYCAPEVTEVLEGNLDPAARFTIMGNISQANTKGLIIGQSIDGVKVNGNTVYFRRDNALSTLVRSGGPNTVAIPGAPAALTFGGVGAGSITQPAVNVAGTGKWAASGERLTGVVYYVTAVNEVGEGVSSNLSAAVNATAGKTVEFTITPRGDEQSFMIYRGYNADVAQPDTFMEPVVRDPQFIMEIPNGVAPGNTTPVVVIDSDNYIPGTTWAWGSDINSRNADDIDAGLVPTSATNDYTVGRSAVALAQLTGLFEFDLAKLGWLHSNKLFANVAAPMVPRPWVNVIWLNVGGIALKKSLLDRP